MKPGDLRHLKIGGPQLVIGREAEDGESVFACWIDSSGDIVNDIFHKAMFEAEEPEDGEVIDVPDDGKIIEPVFRRMRVAR